MAQLGVGSMDDIKTGFEVMEAQKKVRVKVLAPKEAGEDVWENDTKTLKMLKLNLEILEGPNTGRWVQLGFTPVFVERSTYLGWKLKKDGRDMTEQEKAEAWDKRDYLKELKRFGDAIDVDFSKQDTTDAYGKELLIDITQKVNDQGEPQNEAKYPRKIK